MQKFNSTMSKLELEDGTNVELTLAFYKIYQLKEKKKEIYKRYNKIIMDGATDLFDFITILYVAYLCANIENLENVMSEELFMQGCGSNMQRITEKAKELTETKKK